MLRNYVFLNANFLHYYIVWETTARYMRFCKINNHLIYEVMLYQRSRYITFFGHSHSSWMHQILGVAAIFCSKWTLYFVLYKRSCYVKGRVIWDFYLNFLALYSRSCCNIVCTVFLTIQYLLYLGQFLGYIGPFYHFRILKISSLSIFILFRIMIKI